MRTWTAIATPGLEPVLARELRDLGVEGTVQPGGVLFRLDLEQGARLAPLLRTPSRLLLLVASGDVHTYGELAKLVRSANWQPFLLKRSTVDVSVTAQGSRLRHRDALEKKISFALDDVKRRLPAARIGQRPHTMQRVQVRIVDDHAQISIDAGGERLDRRGWRLASGKAALRENLGAAMLIAAGWQGDEALVDPFCGAGTLPIEAALLAANRSPGPTRRYACADWPASGSSSAPPTHPIRVPIVGADKDPQVLASARENARRAKVSVDWVESDVAQIQPPAPTGLVVANPPYGKRLGQHVQGVYSAFGRTLRDRFSGWRCAFLAPDPALAARVDRHAERLTVFSNGGLHVGLYATTIR